MRAVRFGVNYVPRERWWYAWGDWDEASIARDLEKIASLGLDHIRIHCLWPSIQPNSGFVSPVILSRVRRLFELASEFDLGVFVTVLDGWLSGFEFYPSWLKDHSMFSHLETIAAEKLLFTELAEVVSECPNFLGFDLGNELGVLQLMRQRAEPAIADAWHNEMLSFCEAVAPGKLHVNGVDHTHWFANHGFSRPALATRGAMTTVHSWAFFTGAFERYGKKGIGSLHLAEYQAELAKAYHTNLDRPVWIQEIGVSTSWMEPDDALDFAEMSIRNVLSSEPIWGITWWCSHDLSSDLKGFQPLEYDLGLIDSAGETKPIGCRFAELIAEFKFSPPAPAKRNVALVLSESMFEGIGSGAIWSFIDAFMALVSDGVRPAIVLEERCDDREYLSARGIAELKRICRH